MADCIEDSKIQGNITLDYKPQKESIALFKI